ncbi:hypothetical protein PBI_PEREGRIN_24 [Rhodococcus phage Peregrin]|nr:hypothetical protein PBI_PEREGRIN_24 [Rhodococcus phage Peregrin]
MTYTINPAQIRWEITRLAVLKPDFKYFDANNLEEWETCRYVDEVTGEGSCIVGQALMNLGVSKEDLSQYEDLGADQVIKELLNLSEKDKIFNGRTITWIREVQLQQDLNHTWAHAVHVANEAAK